jgi:phosphoglycerol transferase MdoB-like AlkP superfamily enzyme
MRLPSLITFIGFVLLIAGTWCPLLRPFGLLNMDVYDLNRPYGFVLLLAGVIGIIGVGLNKIKLVRLTAWLALILVVLLFVAAYLKVNASFSFIPFKSFAGFLTRQIKFTWGWYVLYAGAGIALIGALIKRSQYSR